MRATLEWRSAAWPSGLANLGGGAQVTLGPCTLPALPLPIPPRKGEGAASSSWRFPRKLIPPPTLSPLHRRRVYSRLPHMPQHTRYPPPLDGGGSGAWPSGLAKLGGGVHTQVTLGPSTLPAIPLPIPPCREEGAASSTWHFPANIPTHRSSPSGLTRGRCVLMRSAK